MPDKKKVKRYRGPSRPIDPRFAPGPVPKKGRDTFGLTLIVVSVLFVTLIIFWAAISQGSTTQTTTTASTSGNTTSKSIDPAATATQHAIDVQPTVIADATETANLPRIEPKDAIALYNAGNVKIFDVRGRDAYLLGHAKGATNIPESEVSTRLTEFPKLGNMIVYCD